MKKILQKVSSVIDCHEDHIRDNVHHQDSAVSFYRGSIRKKENALIAMARDHKERYLMVISVREDGIIAEFTGEQIGDSGVFARKCPLSAVNAQVLRQIFPFTAPVSLRDRTTTIGCGDRFGLATSGHIAAVNDFEVAPILAQQSMKELDATKRTYHNVVDDATFMVFQAGYTGGYGADGDQLTNIGDINIALEAGISMITLDLSESMNTEALSWSGSEIEEAFSKLPEDLRLRTEKKYANQTFQIGKKSITINSPTARRCSVAYIDAIDFATKVYKHLKSKRGNEFDLEISLTGTDSHTPPEHHLFIANELSERKVKYTSLAPKLIGDFQRGLDYSGDIREFKKKFRLHAEIAKALGSYKISIHSGSDKFSIYPSIGKMTNLELHLKTSGTSWLEATRIIAENEPVLYRVMHNCAVEHFNNTIKNYDIEINLAKLPNVDKVYDEDLSGLLDRSDVRQMMHISYGPVLNDHSIKPMFQTAMHLYEEEYREHLKSHFQKHLNALGIPRTH